MPDITMCKGVKYQSECPMKDFCYRYKVVPNEFRQSYFMSAPFEIREDFGVVCEYFSVIQKGDRLKEGVQDGEG